MPTSNDVSLQDFAVSRTGYDRVIEKFSSRQTAERYPWGYARRLKPQLERQAVIAMLSLLPSGGHILDLPSGTGRISQLLLERGFEVTLADASPEMIDRARGNLASVEPQWLHRTTYEIQHADATSYHDDEFDGVICNRLLHHYSESATRVAVLRELSRISRGPVITSIACFSLSTLHKKSTFRLRRKSLRDYQPISLAQFRREHEAAGMRVQAIRPVLCGLSRMWYFAGVRNRPAVSTKDSPR